MPKKSEIKKINLKLTRNEIYEMSNVLKSLAKTKLSVFIKFDIGHNINIMKNTVDLIDSIKNNNDDIEGFKDYQKGIRDIFMKHSVDGVIKGAEKTAAYHHDLEVHKDSNPEISEALENKEKELKEKLEEEEELKGLVKLKLSKFPNELDIDITSIIPLIERE